MGFWKSTRARIRPISAGVKVGTTRPQRGLLIVGSIFSLFGLVVFYFTFIRPVVSVFTAQNWEPTAAIILSSHVVTANSSDEGSGKHGSTYSVYINYKYRFSGQDYEANRYNFMVESTPGYESKQDIVKDYPVGREIVCYVNPRDPSQAVVEPGFTSDMLVGLFPLIFVGAGLWIMSLYLRSASRPRGMHLDGASSALPAWLPNIGSGLEKLEDGSVYIQTASSPTLRWIGLSFFALFWNVILCGFFIDYHPKKMSASEVLFFMPFALIGLALMGAAFYYFLALWNPRIKLVASRDSVILGKSLDLSWAIRGRTQMLKDLTFRLQAREEATYRTEANIEEGVTSVTDYSVFFNRELLRIPDVTNNFGSLRVEIPANTMHSLDLGNNKILWTIHVEGSVTRWLDLKEEFPILVLPHQGEMWQ